MFLCLVYLPAIEYIKYKLSQRQEAEELDPCEFKASLVYPVSSRLARTT